MTVGGEAAADVAEQVPVEKTLSILELIAGGGCILWDRWEYFPWLLFIYLLNDF